MKKLLFLLPMLALLAAGCNAAPSATEQNKSVVQKQQQEQPTKPVVDKSAQQPRDKTVENNIYVNSTYGLEFTLPNGYSVIDKENPGDDADESKAKSFYFIKTQTSIDHRGVPILEVDVPFDMQLSQEQTLQQLAQSVYNKNKKQNYATTELKSVNYGGVTAYEFGLKTGYTNITNSGKLLDYGRGDTVTGKVVLLYKNGKLFQFLQTGADSGLISILNSLRFK